MTVRSTKSGRNGSTNADKLDSSGGSTLDRRRDKMLATRSAAETQAAAVSALDKRLDVNSGQRRGHEVTLAAALARVVTLKKAIKASAKDRDTLLGARKDARRAAAKAAQRAETAQARYDRAVLDDMLRREKAHDLASHPDPRPGEQPGEGTDRGPNGDLTRALMPHTGGTRSSTTTRPRSETMG